MNFILFNNDTHEIVTDLNFKPTIFKWCKCLFRMCITTYQNLCKTTKVELKVLSI